MMLVAPDHEAAAVFAAARRALLGSEAGNAPARTEDIENSGTGPDPRRPAAGDCVMDPVRIVSSWTDPKPTSPGGPPPGAFARVKSRGEGWANVYPRADGLQKVGHCWATRDDAKTASNEAISPTLYRLHIRRKEPRS